MNNTQLPAVLGPIVAALAAFLASKYPLLDIATWNTLVTTFVLVGLSAYLGWKTNKSSLADSLGQYKDTTVVTDKKTADGLPSNSSVVSNTEAKVSAK